MTSPATHRRDSVSAVKGTAKLLQYHYTSAQRSKPSKQIKDASPCHGTSVLMMGAIRAFHRAVREQPATRLAQSNGVGFISEWARSLTWEEGAGGDEAPSLSGNGGDGEAAAGELTLQLLRPRRHPSRLLLLQRRETRSFRKKRACVPCYEL